MSYLPTPVAYLLAWVVVLVVIIPFWFIQYGVTGARNEFSVIREKLSYRKYAEGVRQDRAE